MNTHRLTIEHLLYTIALILALGLRMYNLGATPLTDAEANWALQGLQLVQRESSGTGLALGPQPGYVVFTGGLFSIFGSPNALARFWPALLGGFLILLPAFFRSDLGRTAALIMAFGLALDPGLVAISRQAGGPMMAVSFGLFALVWWRVQKPVLAGVFGGLALLSGPAILAGALGFVAAFGLVRLFVERTGARDGPAGWEMRDDPASQRAGRLALFSSGAAVLLVGTFFLYSPQGLAAWLGTLPAFLGGWVNPSGVPAIQLLAALVVFQPFVIAFGLIGAITSWTDSSRLFFGRSDPFVPHQHTILFLVFWALLSLVLALVYPGRQVSDLAWTLIPLWALAALELARHVPERFSSDEISPVSLGQAVLVFLLLSLFWLTLAGLSRALPGLAAPAVQIGVLSGIIALIVLTAALISLGWSWEVSRRGLVWGLTAVAGVYLLAAAWGAAHQRPNQPQELWSRPPAAGEAAMLVTTLQQLSTWQTGLPHKIDLSVAVDTPSLRWVLRDFPEARFVSVPAFDELPSVIITRAEAEAPELAAAYRGQDFAWWIYPGWDGALPPDTSRWLTFREAHLQVEQIILWARTDLFPGGTLESSEGAPISPP